MVTVTNTICQKNKSLLKKTKKKKQKPLTISINLRDFVKQCYHQAKKKKKKSCKLKENDLRK